MGQAFGFLSYYAARRLLGVVARLVDGYERRERLRTDPEGARIPRTHTTPPGTAQRTENDHGCMCPQIDTQETP